MKKTNKLFLILVAGGAIAAIVDIVFFGCFFAAYFRATGGVEPFSGALKPFSIATGAINLLFAAYAAIFLIIRRKG